MVARGAADGVDGLGRKQRAPQIGMKYRAGRIDDASKGRSTTRLDSLHHTSEHCGIVEVTAVDGRSLADRLPQIG